MSWQEFIEDKTSFHFSIIICMLGLPFHVIVIGIINAYVFSCGNNDGDPIMMTFSCGIVNVKT
jgi:hypothetical protein